MVRSELVKRSPLRVFENSIHGGLGSGNLGVIASRKGVGKTACMVHIATDKLFNRQHVIHVSFSSKPDHIISWYEDIFKEIAKKRDLENAVEVHDEIIKNRVIMSFNKDGLKVEQILISLKAMIKDGNFPADAIIFDGMGIENITKNGLAAIKEFAEELGCEVWLSASLKGDEPVFDDNGFPFVLQELESELCVVVTLAYVDNYVRLELVKNREERKREDMHLRLDPKTLLIAEE